MSMGVKEGVSPAEASVHFDVENHEPTASIPGVTFDATPKVKEQKQTLVSTVQCSLVHSYRTPRARPLTKRRSFLQRE